VAKITRKKSPAAAKSSGRKTLAVATRSKASPRTSRAVATTAKASTKPAAKSTKPFNHHRPAEVRPASRNEVMISRPIPEAVPTDGRPRKNEAGLNLRDLEHFRDLLLAKRRELVGDMSQMEREALRTSGGTNLSTLPMHMADMGTDNYEQEFTLGLVEKDRNLLREINAALAKIQNGTYGICEGTGKPISRPRLEAQPWARYSIEYARQLERGQFRRMM
jgi:DnaK suppressor protein